MMATTPMEQKVVGEDFVKESFEWLRIALDLFAGTL